MAENRQHPRRSVQVPAAFRVADAERVEATCTDVSLGGAYLETPIPAAYGAQIVVYLPLPGFKGEAALSSTVRWVKKGEGMGVQFGVMGARETHALIALLQRV